MFQKRQLPFVAPGRLFDLPDLGKVALQPVGNCDHSTGFFAFFHAAGAEAASRGYIQFQLKFSQRETIPHWTAKPVHFDMAAGPGLEHLIAAIRRLIDGLMAANPLTHYHQVSGAVAGELAAERRRAALSWKTPSSDEQARIALMRRLEAALRGWSKSYHGKDAPSIASVLDDVLKTERIAA